MAKYHQVSVVRKDSIWSSSKRNQKNPEYGKEEQSMQMLNSQVLWLQGLWRKTDGTCYPRGLRHSVLGRSKILLRARRLTKYSEQSLRISPNLMGWLGKILEKILGVWEGIVELYCYILLYRTLYSFIILPKVLELSTFTCHFFC